MKNRLHHLWNAICQPKFLYFYYLIALILPNAGIGYRWEFKKGVNVRLDVGFGRGEKSFNFSLNEAF